MSVAVASDLLFAAQAGDRVAIARLLSELQPDIRRYARRQCHRSSVLEDVVQEALIVVYRKVGHVRSPAALGGWLITVVRRLCMLPALMLSRGAEALGEAEERRHFASVPAHDLRLDLARAIESLPAHHRQIVLLRDFEELTIGEMAAQLALTPEAVKSRLHRARALLREYLLGSTPKTQRPT